MADFWIPPTKRQLIEWLKGQNISFKSTMSKKQLYAIFFRVRKGL